MKAKSLDELERELKETIDEMRALVDRTHAEGRGPTQDELDRNAALTRRMDRLGRALRRKA